MDLDIIKLNVINVFVLYLTFIEINQVITIILGITATLYNLLKIYSWFKNNKGNSRGRKDPWRTY